MFLYSETLRKLNRDWVCGSISSANYLTLDTFFDVILVVMYTLSIDRKRKFYT